MTRRSDASWAEETDAHRRKPDRQDRQDAAELGRRVRSRRKELHLSQERLGEISGLHRTYIGHVERGEVNPTLHNVLLMAHALGLDAGELVRGLRADIDPADPEPGTGTVVDQHTQATRGGGTTSTTE